MTEEIAPVIIRKRLRTRAHAHAHHGGAWKVAYADFVTAMMAFFLLLWLLSATSEEQRKGIADYFDPTLPVSRISAGGVGMLNGENMFSESPASGTLEEGVRPRRTAPFRGETLGDRQAGPDLTERDDAGSAALRDGVPDPADPGTALPRGVDAEALDQEVRAALEDGLAGHFQLRSTPEGLVIELVDLTDEPLFATGSAAPNPALTRLIEIIAPVIGKTLNGLAIDGHTDAAPFGPQATYTNWELSAERANAARRLLVGAGLDAARIRRVSGKAATDPIEPDPLAAKNRRIGIVLLHRSAR